LPPPVDLPARGGSRPLISVLLVEEKSEVCPHRPAQIVLALPDVVLQLITARALRGILIDALTDGMSQREGDSAYSELRGLRNCSSISRQHRRMRNRPPTIGPRGGETVTRIPANQETVPCGGYPKQLRPTVSRLGFVERVGVGPQADLVHHH
jgi:hypothetical protein